MALGLSRPLVLLLVVVLLFLLFADPAAAFDRPPGKKNKRRKKRAPASSSSSKSSSSSASSSVSKASASSKASTAASSSSSTDAAAAAASSSSSSSPSATTLVYPLEHATSAWGDAFTSRGSIEVTISKRSMKVRVDSSKVRKALTAEETADLRALAEAGQFYRLRMPDLPGSDRKVVASIPACALFSDDFQESLWLHMDLEGNLQAFDYTTTVGTSAHCDADALRASLAQLDQDGGLIQTATSVVLAKARSPHRVPTRITGKFNPPPGMEHLRKVSKEEQEAASQPGFFRRYWYIIVPVVILTLLK